MKKPRQTYAKRIEAEPDLLKAEMLALYGHCESQVELMLRRHLTHNFSPPEKALADAIFAAVESRDIGTLEAIPRIVAEYAKPVMKNGRPVFSIPNTEDTTRALLVTWKALLSDWNQTLTIEEVSKLVQGKSRREEPDGYSALRRLCKRLKFPLAPSKRGPKVIQDR